MPKPAKTTPTVQPSELDFDNLDFDSLSIIELPVRIDGEDYMLRELDGKGSVRHKNAQMACTIIDPKTGKPAGLKNIGSLEPLLIHLCLFEKDKNGEFTVNVPEEKILSWPAKRLTVLHAKAKKISNLKSNPPERKALEKALELANAPITGEQLGDFIMSLTGDEYKPIQAWFEPQPEEQSKN